MNLNGELIPTSGGLSLIAARIFVATHETTSYAGAEMSLGLGSVPAVAISTYTSAPGSLWGASGGVADMNVVSPFAVAAAIVVGASCAVWVIVVLAPMPFVLSAYWVQVLVTFGQTYMHSLIQLWCWSMVIAVVLLEITRRRRSPAMTAVVALVLTLGSVSRSTSTGSSPPI